MIKRLVIVPQFDLIPRIFKGKRFFLVKSRFFMVPALQETA